MIRKEFVFSLIFLFLLFTAVTFLLAQDCAKGREQLHRETASNSVQYSYFNINNISTIIYNDGRADFLPGGSSGCIFPKGSGKGVIYQSGLLWGGKVNGEIHVGGSTYRTGLRPGRILPDGVTYDTNSESTRIYRVRRDYQSSNLASEVADEKKSASEIFEQYEKDWTEWPGQWGAPFEDIDGDGKYNPAIDIPGIPGADQTLWFAANDLDYIRTVEFYSSPPVGIELQVTVWGYNTNEPLGNLLFKKYKIINKSKNEIRDMYVSLWADVDVGDANNDYVGCDTLLDLGYGYNALAEDVVYDRTPPAVGILLVQGPMVEGTPNDVALFDGKKFFGKRNLSMTAFNHFI